MAIAAMTGLSYPAARLAIDLYEEGGYGALKPRPRGRESGQGRTLTAEQEAVIQRTICDKRPEQLKMEFALWSRAAVRQLIEQEFGVKLAVRTVGDYLKRWGFTPQKPIKKAYEQRPEAVQAWLDEQSNIRKLRNGPRPKAERYTGATRQPWSIPMCVAVATPRQARLLSPTRWAARGKSYR